MLELRQLLHVLRQFYLTRGKEDRGKSIHLYNTVILVEGCHRLPGTVSLRESTSPPPHPHPQPRIIRVPTGHCAGYEVVDVSVAGSRQLQSPETDVVQSLVVDAESFVAVFNETTQRQLCIVRLNNSLGNLQRQQPSYSPKPIYTHG